MGFFRKKKNIEEDAAPAEVDLSQVSDDDFWGAAQALIETEEDKKIFGENILETFGNEDALSSENADNARFRLTNPGYKESQVDDFVADVVDTLRYYESLVIKLHEENEALNDHVNHLRSMIEVFRVQGRVDMDDQTADMLKQAPTRGSVSTSMMNESSDFADSPFGSDDDSNGFSAEPSYYANDDYYEDELEEKTHPQTLTRQPNDNNTTKQRSQRIPLSTLSKSTVSVGATPSVNTYETLHSPTILEESDEDESAFGFVDDDEFANGFPTAIDDE